MAKDEVGDVLVADGHNSSGTVDSAKTHASARSSIAGFGVSPSRAEQS